MISQPHKTRFISCMKHICKRNFYYGTEGGMFTKSCLVHDAVGRCPRGVIVKAMDCGIVVSEFVLQSRYYVHFRANTLEKGMNPLILPAMG